MPFVMIDHYSVLGVMPNTEPLLIASAYRALASKYQPDRWNGDAKAADDRMAQINLAHLTLSDSFKRKEYDRRTVPERRWDTTAIVFPDLLETRERLARISQQLAFEFVTNIIETKTFNRRHKLAEVMEQSFLNRCFGDDPLVVNFARELIDGSRQDAMEELNRYVVVLGADLPAEVIIGKMRVDFAIVPILSRDERTIPAHGITTEGRLYRFRDYRYEKLADAIRYAELVFSRERSGGWQ